MIEKFNNLSIEDKQKELEKCCGSSRWISAMVVATPFKNLNSMHEKCDQIWSMCKEEDYLEAFSHHPQIGDITSLKEKFAHTSKWASNEQQGTSIASDDLLLKLKSANDTYLKKFGFIFIVCATGKTAEQMLELLENRMSNNRLQELITAASEQNKITHLRIDKLINP
ncbi:MAG: 2-oxo-4-hydroxy-4-carboxy-5-ureidoimidazoline decarboxylase [Marinicellaceae bacterium]